MNILDLMNRVPKDRLHHHISAEKLKSGNDLHEMYDTLLKNRKPVADTVLNEYKNAGRTSVNIFEAINFPQEYNSKRAFLAHLKARLGISTNIVGVDIRPEIQEYPQINYIEEMDNGFLIQWVSGKKKQEMNGYNVIERIVPSFEIMIVRFGSPMFVELRSSYTLCKRYLSLISSILAKDENSPAPSIEWVPLTKVSEAEALLIAQKLQAGLLESEHLGSGCIGRYAFSAAPGIEDLTDQPQYQELIVGKEYLAQTLHVSYSEVETGYETKVKFRINMKGGFEFKSKVSEGIIKRVLDVFVEVRYHKQASGA